MYSESPVPRLSNVCISARKGTEQSTEQIYTLYKGDTMHVSRQKKRWHGGGGRTVGGIDSRGHGRRVCGASAGGSQDCLKRYRQKIREIEAQEAAEEARRGGLTRFGDELIAWFGRYKTGGTGATVTSDMAQM